MMEGDSRAAGSVRSRDVLRAVARRVYAFEIPVVGPVRWVYKALYWCGGLAVEAARVALSVALWKPLFRARCAKVGRRLSLETLPYVIGRGAIEVGDDVRISGKIGVAFTRRVTEHPRLQIGHRVFIGHDCGFTVAREVVVEDDCLIAGSVCIRDNDGHPLDAEARRMRLPIRPEDAQPVRIGRNAWIGGGSLILKGVTVGENSVVAAHSVVTQDVPPDCLAAGAPAKVIRRLE